MNLGWIRELFTLSEIEKERIQETAADPRQIQVFREIEPLIANSLLPPVVQNKTSTRILTENAQPKSVATRTRASSLPDQALLQKLLQQRPQYTSNRILRAEKIVAQPQSAEAAAAIAALVAAAPQANHSNNTDVSDDEESS